jgi:AcrR family transcriptional regulator
VGDVSGVRPASRRERLKREREERILDAAATVFTRKGYHQATIREIAELADVADGTIYDYYANKRDLQVAMTQYVVADSMGDTLAEFEAKDDWSYLPAVLKSRVAFQERNAHFVHALMSEVWNDATFRDQYLSQVIALLLHLMERYLQARIEAGAVRLVNTGMAVRAMVGSFLIFVTGRRRFGGSVRGCHGAGGVRFRAAGAGREAVSEVARIEYWAVDTWYWVGRCPTYT